MIQLPIALQAYSLRRIYEENPLRALKLIREAGYVGVELYGPHFQTELYPALLREAGLVCAGWHTGIDALEQDFDNTLRRNLAVGNHSIAVPWFNADSAAGWKAFAERLNTAAEKLSRYGIRLGYHNHAHEFQPVNGETPWSIVAENTEGPVFLQLDTGNAAEGGADPLAELEKYPHRARTVHLKPYSKGAGFAPAVGEDDLPWEAMLESCEQRGATEWLIVEYEEEKDPVSAVQRSLSFLRKLRPRD